MHYYTFVYIKYAKNNVFPDFKIQFTPQKHPSSKFQFNPKQN